MVLSYRQYRLFPKPIHPFSDRLQNHQTLSLSLLYSQPAQHRQLQQSQIKIVLYFVEPMIRVLRYTCLFFMMATVAITVASRVRQKHTNIRFITPDSDRYS